MQELQPISGKRHATIQSQNYMEELEIIKEHRAIFLQVCFSETGFVSLNGIFLSHLERRFQNYSQEPQGHSCSYREREKNAWYVTR